ncbi:MAG TPA: hypothetical protein VM534_01325 [Thermoanaerobaculia bacterium]|nr:hypothetical protein [Thermoanaerobaculia bacterium]
MAQIEIDRGGGSNKVQLGCGTLILIALIVLIFSGGPSDDVEDEVRELQEEIEQLQEQVDRLEQKIDRLVAE